MLVTKMGEAVQPENRHVTRGAGPHEEGYMLLGLIVAVALLLLWLGAAASYEAFQIRRDREVETARRADQYVRAIRLYYKKFGHYPGSIDQLEKSNNIRFLRRKWIDPLTKTTDWRLISVGQNKTTPKGFFGEPLAGLPTSGLGALAGSQSAGIPGPRTPGAPVPAGGAFGAGSGIGAGIGTLGGPAPGAGPAAPAAAPGAATAGATPDAAAVTGAANPAGGGISGTGTAPGGMTNASGAAPGAPGGGTAGANSPFGSGNGLGGTNGAIMGVGTNAKGDSILDLNEQTTYQDWEFLYDPRVELLRQKQQLNQGLQTNGAGASGQTTGIGAPTTPAGATGAPGGSSAIPPPPGDQAPQAAPPGPGSVPTAPPPIGAPVQQ